MRLNRFQRAGLAVLGLLVLGGGVTAAIMDVGAAGVVTLILPGLLVIVFAIVGVFPNVHLKEGNIDWPKIEEPKVIEPKVIKPPADGRAREEIAQLREELKTVRTRLEDYILTRETSPTDVEKLLSELLDAYQELDRDIGHREWEDHDDGTSLDELRNQRDGLRARILTLERWRQAHTPFGETAETPK
jgi:hypothetical protein